MLQRECKITIFVRYRSNLKIFAPSVVKSTAFFYICKRNLTYEREVEK